MKEKKPLFSFVIPAHNEEDVIGKCLDSVLKQDGNYEAIVVNDGSTDKTREIVEKYVKKYPKKIKLINFSRGHSAAFAINRGVENAKGEYVIFIAADMIVTPNFLKEVKKALPFEAASYILKSYRPSNFLQKAWKAYRNFAVKIGVIYPFMFKKDIFVKVGKYDEKIFYQEDADLKKRVLENGYQIKLIKNAVVFHIDPYTMKEFIRQRRWQGRMAPLKYFIPCIFPPVLIFQLIRMIKVTKDIHSFYWIILDFFGRYVSLLERLRFL